jgi:hypothetical protein
VRGLYREHIYKLYSYIHKYLLITSLNLCEALVTRFLLLFLLLLLLLPCPTP